MGGAWFKCVVFVFSLSGCVCVLCIQCGTSGQRTQSADLLEYQPAREFSLAVVLARVSISLCRYLSHPLLVALLFRFLCACLVLCDTRMRVVVRFGDFRLCVPLRATGPCVGIIWHASLRLIGSE